MYVLYLLCAVRFSVFYSLATHSSTRFPLGQPIFDNQDRPGYGYSNCSDPASAYYDKKRCVGCAFDAREAALSAAVGAYWARLAAAGAPSADAGEWPAFAAADGRRGVVLHPDFVSRVEVDMGRGEACALWDEVARRAAAGARR